MTKPKPRIYSDEIRTLFRGLDDVLRRCRDAHTRLDNHEGRLNSPAVAMEDLTARMAALEREIAKLKLKDPMRAGPIKPTTIRRPAAAPLPSNAIRLIRRMYIALDQLYAGNEHRDWYDGMAGDAMEEAKEFLDEER